MKHFFASAAMAALVADAAPALAETPDDQLVAAITMNNILTMDPAALTGGEAVQVLNNVYDALVQFDPETYELQPRIAESWEYSGDNRSVTLKLRPDVTFASGNPLTAHDVKFSLDRVMELGLAQSSGLSSRGFTAENVDEHFVVEDDHTFTINLPQADDPQLILMYLTQAGVGSILDRELVMEHEENGDMGQAWLNNNSAGSGAFVLDQWRSNEYVILTRNDEFWGGAPEMQRILMRHLPESQSQRLGLEQGDLDVGFTLAAPDLRALEDAEGIEVETVPSAGFYYLAASMEDERFANPKVREALRYLIDYDGINSAIMPYFGVERQRPVNTNAFGALEDPDTSWTSSAPVSFWPRPATRMASTRRSA